MPSKSRTVTDGAGSSREPGARESALGSQIGFIHPGGGPSLGSYCHQIGAIALYVVSQSKNSCERALPCESYLSEPEVSAARLR